MVKVCDPCQQSQPLPTAAPLHPWQWPTRPWSRLYIDYAGPLEGKMFLVVIDAHSKWIEVFPMSSATALTTVQQLHQLFSRFGLPDSIISDNGTQFTAQEFDHEIVWPMVENTNGNSERVDDSDSPEQLDRLEPELEPSIARSGSQRYPSRARQTPDRLGH